MLNSDKHGHFGSIYEYQCFHDDHDDVMQREGFPHLLPFGKPRASGYKGPVTWSSSVLFDVSLNTGWTNSRVDGDLKGRGTHVTSHQHRFLFRLSDGVIGNARRNLTKSCVTSHVNVELKGHTCRGSSSILPICSAETYKHYHGAILFGGNCRHRGLLYRQHRATRDIKTPHRF